MRIVFMGTPDFAVPSLEGLIGAGHQVCGVFCQPDKPVGRHQNKLQAGPGLGGVADPADDLQGGVVAAHGVNDNFHAFSPYFRFFHHRCRWKNMSDPTVRNGLYLATVYLAAPPGVNTQSAKSQSSSAQIRVPRPFFP